MKSSHIAEFFDQLALLTRARMPLPDSLRELAGSFPHQDFQATLQELSARTEGGESLHQALGAFPEAFTPFQRKLIEIGEDSNTLPEILTNVASFARFNQIMILTLRDILAYPLVTFHLALLIFGFLSMVVLPAFHEIFADMLGGARLPVLTQLVLDAGSLVYNNRILFVVLYGLFILLSIWIFLPGLAPHRTLSRILQFMPGSWRITESADAARACRMLGTFLQNRMPLHDALAFAAELVESTALRRAFREAAAAIEQGTSATDALTPHQAVHPLILLTLDHAPEAELGAEFLHLGDVFEHRVTLSARSVSTAWALIAVFASALLVGAVGLALFLPLVHVTGNLSG